MLEFFKNKLKKKRDYTKLEHVDNYENGLGKIVGIMIDKDRTSMVYKSKQTFENLKKNRCEVYSNRETCINNYNYNNDNDYFVDQKFYEDTDCFDCMPSEAYNINKYYDPSRNYNPEIQFDPFEYYNVFDD